MLVLYWVLCFLGFWQDFVVHLCLWIFFFFLFEYSLIFVWIWGSFGDFCQSSFDKRKFHKSLCFWKGCILGDFKSWWFLFLFPRFWKVLNLHWDFYYSCCNSNHFFKFLLYGLVHVFHISCIEVILYKLLLSVHIFGNCGIIFWDVASIFPTFVIIYPIF